MRSTRTEKGRSATTQFRVDIHAKERRQSAFDHSLVLIVLAACLQIVGSVNRDVTADEARIGLSALERVGPYGQAFGGWEPSILPGRVLPSSVLYQVMGEAWAGWSGLILWPGALALVAISVFMARQCQKAFGTGSGLIAILLLNGSALFMELPGGMMAHALTGLPVVCSLGWILTRGSNWTSGILAALAVFCGGWPALVLIAAPIMILGRPGAYLSVPMLLPPLATFVAWSVWALKAAPSVVWGQAITAPLRQSPGWVELPLILILLLPGLGLAVAALSGALRASWPASARSWALAWAQVGLVTGLLGTLVPGLAPVAWFPLAAAVAVLATGVVRAFLTSARVGPQMTRLIFGVAVVANLLWTVLAVPRLVYVTASMGYYREMAIISITLTAFALAFALVGAWEGRRRWCVASLVGLSLALKVAHAGVYVPERDYRIAQGPWAHAVGQWVPPRLPIYTLHTWPADFAFDLCRPVRQIVSAQWLGLVDSPHPRYVLLLQAEFEHWPADAPAIEKVRDFEDDRGGVRVLARTTNTRPPWKPEAEQADAAAESERSVVE